jgi:hypothetical protein
MLSTEIKQVWRPIKNETENVWGSTTQK